MVKIGAMATQAQIILHRLFKPKSTFLVQTQTNFLKTQKIQKFKKNKKYKKIYTMTRPCEKVKLSRFQSMI